MYDLLKTKGSRPQTIVSDCKINRICWKVKPSLFVSRESSALIWEIVPGNIKKCNHLL